MQAALSVVERIWQSISALGVPHEASPTNVVTVSLGVAAWPVQLGETEDRMIVAADKALYEAKDEGRDQVRVWNRRHKV